VARAAKAVEVSLTTLPAAEAIRRLGSFGTIIDARSEAEFAEDHLPGAVNWPTLNNAERADVGTIYKQVGAFEAKKKGAMIAARNISAHIERECLGLPKDWQPLIYCWRGGKRSGSLSLVLDQIGFKVTLLEGGYKAFRAAMVQDTERLTATLRFEVICGRTGSGKTRLLQALHAQGAQVLDLEHLAKHRSSVLGLIPGVPQPTQKGFETRVWHALRQLDPARTVYVESESKKVGNVVVPTPLMDAMRASPCLHLEMADPDRVALLLQDYDFFVTDPEFFCARLDALAEIRGKAVVQNWQVRVRTGSASELAQVVQELLTQHYDPVYMASMKRNFTQFATAKLIAACGRSDSEFDRICLQILRQPL
jgi:tRNA 2-selenouridine synthase